jgi:uncharacterized protein YcfL
MRALVLSFVLLASVLAVGCSSSTPASSTEGRPLVGNRIPHGAGPNAKKEAGRAP